MTTATPNQKYTNDELEQLGEIMKLLSASRRVHVLEVLRERESIPRRELISRVTERTYPDEHPTGQTRKRTAISLYQNHLPAMHSMGALFWNKETDEIRRGGRYEEAIAVLDGAMLMFRQS